MPRAEIIEDDEVMFKIEQRTDGSLHFTHTTGFEKMLPPSGGDEIKRLQQSEKLLERVLTELFYANADDGELCWNLTAGSTVSDHNRELSDDLTTFISDACLSV